MGYEVVVGLEVHVELSTNTKAYCGCKNVFGEEVNTHCCEICLGLPGALPSLNEEVVALAVKAGTALNCDINQVSKQDRKHYFYPDLVKAYQISQEDIPLCEKGHLEILVDGEKRDIGITRIHIEEDTCKLLHHESFSGTLIDYNRSSVPLIEIVTEPDIRTPKEARTFLENLRQILVYIGVSDGKMQEGSIRCDVNVSVRKEGATEYGTRVEMKNVNTFSGAERAIEYESARQIAELEAGNELHQETRRWDDSLGKNFVMRDKNDAVEYFFFPDGDLGTIVVSDELLKETKENMPELPNIKFERYVKEYKLSEPDAELMISQKDKSDFFERAVAESKVKEEVLLANWILGDVTKILRDMRKDIDESNLTHEMLADMVSRIEANEISNASGKIIVEEILKNGKTVEEVIEEKGLHQISDTDALLEIVDEVISENGSQIEEYHAGKTNILGYLVGQCMKKSKGKGNPGIMKELLLSKIEK